MGQGLLHSINLYPSKFSRGEVVTQLFQCRLTSAPLYGEVYQLDQILGKQTLEALGKITHGAGNCCIQSGGSILYNSMSNKLTRRLSNKPDKLNSSLFSNGSVAHKAKVTSTGLCRLPEGLVKPRVTNGSVGYGAHFEI